MKLATLIAAGALSSCSADSRLTYCYERVSLDVRAMTLRPERPLAPECPDHSANAYSRLTDVQGRHHINHVGPFRDVGRAERGRVYYNMFTASSDYTLMTRTKEQLLLDGPFGRVYAKSVYYYAREYVGQATTFEVRSYLLQLPYEQPEEVTSLRPGLPLDGISVVRVLRHEPGFLVISADYGPNGEMAAIHVNGTKSGEWTNLPTDSKLAGLELGVSRFRDWSTERARFGFPEMFPVASFLDTPTPAWGVAPYTEHVTAVHLHYARNRWVVQHVFPSGAPPMTRVLRFVVTPEDAALEPIDDSRRFGIKGRGVGPPGG